MSKKRVNRRDFLRYGLVSASGVALAACGQPSPAAAPTAAPQAAAAAPAAAAAGTGACAVTAPGTFPVVKDKATLNIFINVNPNVKDMNTNDLTVEYEARTNVHVNWQVVPSEGMAEKRNLLLASGNLPDVMMGVALSREDQFQYGMQGLLVPLNDLI